MIKLLRASLPAKRRLTRVLALAASLSVALGLMAVPAQAAMICSGAPAINLCLWIDGQGNNRYRVHVGIDVHMSLAEAQEYVDDAGDPFSAVIIGSAGLIRFGVPQVGLGATSESGLSGDFEIVVLGSQLNENPGARTGFVPGFS
ncbi:hypothetical protein ACFQ1L_33475 [Phytohabitans flavus]|uniref:Uncharacterized protein n=1 Tax=Phytohabitans flavus TaxID=1076124 RepID=A0A6F8XMI9_9ACTN|nr:hypothetical protein [Phytohabitans flavus]BCB75030.1 hypothetical protein Pflav_014400 [Phytohabitans flavus]